MTILKCISPIDGSVYAERPAMGFEDAKAAIARVRKAQKAGAIRKDATVDEVWILFGGICRALGDAGEKDPKVWRRHTDLVVDAFRP